MLESMTKYYCIFFLDHKLELGWIEGIQKNKLIVIPPKGKPKFLLPNRLAYSWREKKLPLNAVQAHENLEQQMKQAEQFKQTCDLETMHSLLDNGREYTLNEFAIDFLDNPENTVCKLGLFLALHQDSFWFKHNRNSTYTPRNSEELALLEVQFARQQEQEKRAVNIQKWIKQLESGEWNSDTKITTEQQNWLDQLLNLLTEGTESPFWKGMSALLDWGTSFGGVEENTLKRWLAGAGTPVSTSRLALLKANIREKFPKEVLAKVELVQQLKSANIAKFPEDIQTFTVDSESTLDYDDAFSVLEWNDRELTVAVHISDLSDSVHPGDPLFSEAEVRISSVYTIEKTIPMLPEELSNDTFSLISGKEKAVLSFKFKLTENGDWNLLEVFPSMTKINENLSYEQADILIENNHDFWGVLNKFCLCSQERRLEKGALNLARKEFYFDISDPEQICITPLNRNSPASRVIEELAIAVNKETARLFQEADFPGIYRTQSPYELIKVVEEGEQLSLDNIRIEPAKLTTIPGTHSGLGCEVYMHVTSPIRRFADLITQRQLKKLIKKEEPVFDTKEMMHWAEEICIRQRNYNKAERDITQYWKLKYLQQHIGEIYAVKIRKKLPNNITEIELLELDCVVPATGLGKDKKGEHILRINEVGLDPPLIEVQIKSFSS